MGIYYYPACIISVFLYLEESQTFSSIDLFCDRFVLAGRISQEMVSNIGFFKSRFLLLGNGFMQLVLGYCLFLSVLFSNQCLLLSQAEHSQVKCWLPSTASCLATPVHPPDLVTSPLCLREMVATVTWDERAEQVAPVNPHWVSESFLCV